MKYALIILSINIESKLKVEMDELYIAVGRLPTIPLHKIQGSKHNYKVVTPHPPIVNSNYPQIHIVMMKITNLLVYPVLIPLRKTFRTSLGSTYQYEGVLVKIETDENVFGWGEASPSKNITKETQETVLKSLSEIKPLITGETPFEIESIMDKINFVFGSSAKASIDIALHDILGKRMGLPLKNVFGDSQNEIRTSITVSLNDVKDAVKEAVKIVDSGGRNIKLKIGLKPDEDIEKIKGIREAVGYEPRIRVDTNQGYSVETAIKILKKMEKYEIEFVEQPVNAKDIGGMRKIRNNIGIPVMADESVHTPKDAVNIIKNDAADMINLKIMKNGGLLNALRIADICSAAGIACMVGCMIETKIGITAGTHIALGKRIIRYADLDGHLDLKFDPTIHGVLTEKGVNKIGDGAGLGLDVDEKVLRSLI